MLTGTFSLTDRFGELLLVIVALSVSSNQSVIAQDDSAASPSAAEKQAVAVLVDKGALVMLDKHYQVSQVIGRGNLGDEELKHVKTFKHLKSLSVSGPKVTREALETLKSLKQLESLTLPSGVFSAAEFEELKQALPDCRMRVLGPEPTFGGESGRGPSSSSGFSGWGGFPFSEVPPSIAVELRSTTIRDLLNLSPQQRQEIDRVTGFEGQRKLTETALMTILTTEQKTRIQQVLLQREGAIALTRPEIAKSLNLTEEQQSRVRRIVEKRQADLRALSDDFRNGTVDYSKSFQKSAQIRSETNEQLLSTLTAEQREQWDSMIGPPLPASTSGRFSPFPSQSPEEMARATFRNLDRDNDKKISEQEWQRSRTTRPRFEAAKIQLKFPVAEVEFVKQYVKVEESDRKKR
jgi:hypothetical protein